jgi:hypothetical protein
MDSSKSHEALLAMRRFSSAVKRAQEELEAELDRLGVPREA